MKASSIGFVLQDQTQKENKSSDSSDVNNNTILPPSSISSKETDKNNESIVSSGNGTLTIINKKSYTIDEAIEACGHGKFQRWVYIAAFLIWWADTAEILVLTFLTTVLTPLWGLSNGQAASIFSSVFIGEVVGSLVLGPLGDRYGRRPIFLTTTIICCIFGFLTATANTFPALIGIRFMVGFAIGGLTIPFDTLSEFLPEVKRGKLLATLNYGWQFGQVLIILFAYVTLGTEGEFVGGNTPENNRPWKVFVALSACPTVIAIIVSFIAVPESPRWLLAKGCTENALNTLRHVATTNGLDATKIFPQDNTTLTEGKENEEGNIRELIKPAWRKITFLLIIVWAVNGFFYFGVLQIATDISSSSSSSSNSEYTYTLNYIPILLGAIFEAFIEIFLTLFIDTIGRKPFQTVSFLVGAITMLVYGFITSNTGQEIMIILSRMGGVVSYVAMSVQVSELLPTTLRGKGHSLASFCQRMGGLASPYLVQSSLRRGATGGIFSAACFVALAAVCLLPETKSKIFGGVVEHIVDKIGDSRSGDDEESDRRGVDKVEN